MLLSFSEMMKKEVHGSRKYLYLVVIKFLYPAACGVGFHFSYSNYFLEIAGRQA